MNDDGGCRIGLSVPSESRYMRLARLMASGVETSCGLPLEEVEDFRIAIDALCSALIELSDGDAVRLAFELADDAVVGTTTAAPGGVLDDERLRLSRQILGRDRRSQHASLRGHGVLHRPGTPAWPRGGLTLRRSVTPHSSVTASTPRQRRRPHPTADGVRWGGCRISPTTRGAPSASTGA